MNDRAAFSQEFLRLYFQAVRKCNSVFREKLCISRQNLLPFHYRIYALSRKHSEFLRLRNLKFLFLFKAAYHRFSQRMLRAKFRSCQQPVQLLPVHPRITAYHSHYLRRATGKSSRLVKSNAGHKSQPFQRVSFPHEKSMFCGVSDRGHDCRRSGQHQGAGTEYHKDRDGADDFACNKPGKGRRRKRYDNDPCGPPVGNSHDFRLA